MAKPEGPHAPLIPEESHDLPAPQAPQVPQAPQALQAPQQPIPHIQPLKWSHFKLKFYGKPDEDAEAHLLRTNNLMDTHGFQKNDKVKRFLWH